MEFSVWFLSQSSLFPVVSASLPSLCLISLYLFHSFCLSCSVSFHLFLFASVGAAFLWNVMIHWLWAVSLKSVCLLSATTEWYITSITCNFLGFIRYIYSPCNGWRLFFSTAKFRISLLHHGPVHGNHYLVWDHAKIKQQSLSLGNFLQLGLI